MGWRDDPIVQPSGSGRNDPVVNPPQDAPAGGAHPQATGFAPEPQAEEPPVLDQIVRGLRVGAQGAGEGVAGVLGFPGWVVETLANAPQAAGGILNEAMEALTGVSPKEARAYEAENFPSFAAGRQQADRAFGQTIDALTVTPEEIETMGAQASTAAGLPPIPEEEMTPRERVVKTATGFGLEGAAGSGGLIRGAASRAARPRQMEVLSAQPGGRQTATAADDDLLTRLTPKPVQEAVERGTAGRTFSGDVATAAGAGATMQSAENLGVPEAAGETFGPGGEFAANLLAAAMGGVGTSSLDRMLRGSIQEAAEKAGIRAPRNPRLDTIDPKTDKRFDSLTVDEGTRIFQEAADDPISARARTLDRFDELVTDDTFAEGGRLTRQEIPTTAVLAEDQGLASLEKGLRTKNEGAFRPGMAARSDRTRRMVEEIGSEEPGRGEAFTEEFGRRAEARRGEAAQRVRAAEEAEEALTSQRRQQGGELAAQGQGREPAAQQLDEIVSETTRSAQARKNELFNAPELQGVTRDTTFLKDAARREMESVTAGADAADEVPASFIQRVQEMGDEASVSDLQARRAELSRVENQARRQEQYALADSARRLKGAIDEDFQRLADEGNPAAKKALDTYAKEFGPVFARGQGDAATEFRKAFNVSRFERTTTPPSETAKKFIRPASPERAESLNRILELSGRADEGRQAARQFLMADLVHSGALNPDGTVRWTQVGKWRQKWGDKTLETASPGLLDDLEQIASRGAADEVAASKLKAELKAARDAAKLTDQEIAKGALGFALDTTPAKAVGRIMGHDNAPQRMADVVAEIGDDAKARTGLKQAVREWLLDAKTNAESGIGKKRPVSLAKISDLFEKHSDTLSKVFDDREMNKLRQVHRLLRDEQIVKAAKAISGSDTTARQEAVKQLERSMEAGLKVYFGMLRGGGLMRAYKVAKEALPGADRAERIERFLTQLSLDPELAAHVLIRDVSPPPPGWNKRLLALLGAGESVRATETSSEE